MDVTVTTPTEWCKTSNFTVSGTGVRAVAAVPQKFLGCKVTLEADTGEVGMRDLTLTWKVLKVLNLTIPFTIPFPGTVDLSQAVPVVPDFLK